MAAVLVDAGALIALLDRSDEAHQRCVAALKAITDPLLTVWPAIVEAMHLLGRFPRAQEALLAMVEDGAVDVADITGFDLPRVKELMRRYRDQPMDFTDAVLVAVAEREHLTRILSFDRHFRIYRLPRRTRFIVLPE